MDPSRACTEQSIPAEAGAAHRAGLRAQRLEAPEDYVPAEERRLHWRRCASPRRSPAARRARPASASAWTWRTTPGWGWWRPAPVAGRAIEEGDEERLPSRRRGAAAEERRWGVLAVGLFLGAMRAGLWRGVAAGPLRVQEQNDPAQAHLVTFLSIVVVLYVGLMAAACTDAARRCSSRHRSARRRSRSPSPASGASLRQVSRWWTCSTCPPGRARPRWCTSTATASRSPASGSWATRCTSGAWASWRWSTRATAASGQPERAGHVRGGRGGDRGPARLGRGPRADGAEQPQRRAAAWRWRWPSAAMEHGWCCWRRSPRWWRSPRASSRSCPRGCW